MQRYYDYPARPARPSGLNWTLFGLNMVLILVLAIRFWGGWEQPHGPVPADRNAQPREVDNRGPLQGDEQTNIKIFEDNAPCTVNVTTFAYEPDALGLGTRKAPRGTGTGFIWNTWEQGGASFGRIVTNFHVINPAMRNGKVDPNLIQVTLDDHSVWKVVDVNFNADKDLAVLWTNAPADRLKKIKVGESHSLKVGQKVYAIGNPFGLNQSLTTGIISALGRQIQSDDSKAPLGDMIQIDAPINPGNSGGPLLDSAGRLIGVNTAIVSPSGASAGVGFAIPVDEVNRVVTMLIKKELPPPRPSLGVHIASSVDLRGKGVLILDVDPDGPAARAGLRPTLGDRRGITQLGDIIQAINDTKIASARDLADALSKYKVGQVVTVTVLRDDEQVKVEVTLGSR